jgi:enamine deaminase RidA (YjgF/YER057c/UK114 family)
MLAFSEVYIHKAQTPTATELYISAVPANPVTTQNGIAELFTNIAKVLNDEQASILEERIFTVKEAAELILTERREVYGKIDDGVLPSILTGKQGRYGVLSGVQVHAVAGTNKPEVLKLDGIPCGRALRMHGQIYISLSGITAPKAGGGTSQARAMLEKGESVLKQLGADFTNVPRTWMWLGDILSWYGEFNKVRNQFFAERGLIGAGSRQQMPASTGIGLGLAGEQCGMDLTAVLEERRAIEFLPVVGRQQCALDYGSAFSRASRAGSPAGKTVFVSGTASIDAKGATTHIGDAQGQIQTTIDNVKAVLRDMSCDDGDVVAAIAYCKSKDIEEVFEEFKGRLKWPWITVVCDICRDDLLFEIEATAIPKSSR